MLVGERGAYRLAQPLEALQVPATVQALLAARIDRLPPEDKRLLQTAAVIGTEVPWPLLQAIADSADEALYRSLAQLVVAGRKWTIWQGKNEHFCHSVVTPLPFYHSLLSCAVWSDKKGLWS